MYIDTILFILSLLQLIQSQFEDVPVDVLIIGGPFPVAAAARLYPDIDQSTTVLVQHRLTHEARKALGELFHGDVLLLPDEMDPKNTAVSHPYSTGTHVQRETVSRCLGIHRHVELSFFLLMCKYMES